MQGPCGTILIFLFIVATTVAIAVQRLAVPRLELVVIHLAKLTSEVRLYAALGGGTE